ncbi:MAG: hypothetical protein GXO61_01065 [Epsilonproteobacteria bacterium]|nr:hypothetical protein [Campylobacterota bacterium]
MRKINLSLALVLLAGVAGSATANSLEEIITNPQIHLQIRPRYEYADVKDNGKSAGKAFTVRTALGLDANLFGVEGLNAQVEMMNVSNFGWVDNYNDLAGNGVEYDVIADPSQTRVTQANISLSGNGLTGIVGRKMVVLDNARFIGNVGWRQMPQTFDLAALAYNGIENLNLLGAYVNRVHQVLKDKKLDTGSVILHGVYKFLPTVALTAYDYMIQNFANHVGARLTGSWPINDLFNVKFTAEYAKQTDPSLTEENDPILVAGVVDPDQIEQDADYYNFFLGTNYAGFDIGVGYELLGEANDGATEFYTPLATLHAMNGWADVFLKGTGTKLGLEDISAKIGYNAGEFGKIVGVYHKFSSDAGSYDYGDEFDVAYRYPITKELGLLLKGAFYKGDEKVPISKNPILKNALDVNKYWIQLDYKFNAQL